ncbi:MAG: RNA polymerase sigma factor [Erysipelotrichaceae bacterium]
MIDPFDEKPCRSLEELVTMYSDMVFRIILQHMHNSDDAKDVLQDVFIKIIKKKPEFTTHQQEKAWIIRVAINTCKDHYKYERLRKHVTLEEGYHSYIETQQTYDILPYVMKLPQKYRDVIYLFYYEEYSVKEIAQLLNKKEATILTHLNRARKKLKEDLKGSEWNEEI